MDTREKITAAISAVINYIQEEEAAIYMQSMMAQEELLVQPPPASATAAPPLGLPVSSPVSLWGASGRQSQMQLRNLMQLRAFNRL
jgi:hypothetical protein